MNEYKSRGIILHSVRHNDKGHIVYMLTEAFGRKSFWINSSRSGRPYVGGVRIPLEPLTIVEFIGKESPHSKFHRFSEISKQNIPQNIITNFTKSSVALFMSELIYRMVRSEGENPMIFDYISQSVNTLNLIENGVPNFHLYFILHLTRFMGYYPQENYTEGSFFDLTRGEYVLIRPRHNMYIEAKESKYLDLLQKISIDSLDSIKMEHASRNAIVEAMIAYINYHEESSAKLASVDVLKEIF